MGSSLQTHLFTDLELRVYRSTADLAATMIRNLQLTSLARERVRRANVVGQISTRMRETLDMDLILQTALREIGDNLDIPSIEVQMGPRVSDGKTSRSDIEADGVSADDAVTDPPAELEQG
jgi:hypothetical protein